MADGKAGGGALPDSAEAGTDALEDGFQGLEAGGVAEGMDLDQFAGQRSTVTNTVTLAVSEGRGGGGVGAPHHIRGGLYADGSCVVAGAAPHCGASRPACRIRRRTRGAFRPAPPAPAAAPTPLHRTGSTVRAYRFFKWTKWFWNSGSALFSL